MDSANYQSDIIHDIGMTCEWRDTSLGMSLAMI